MEGQNINTPNHTHSPSLSRIIILLFFAFIIVIISSVVTVYYLSSQLAQQSEPVQNVLIPSIKPTSTITTDETANWKTYTNTKYGFEFKYPPHLKQFKWPNAIITLATPDYKVETTPGAMNGATLKGAKLKLEVLQLGANPIIKEDFVTRRCEYLKISSPNLGCKQLTILNSSSAEVIDKIAEEIRAKTVFIEKDKKAFVLSVDVAWPITEFQEFFNTFDQILSTFKFLN